MRHTPCCRRCSPLRVSTVCTVWMHPSHDRWYRLDSLCTMYWMDQRTCLRCNPHMVLLNCRQDQPIQQDTLHSCLLLRLRHVLQHNEPHHCHTVWTGPCRCHESPRDTRCMTRTLAKKKNQRCSSHMLCLRRCHHRTHQHHTACISTHRLQHRYQPHSHHTLSQDRCRGRPDQLRMIHIRSSQVLRTGQRHR